MPTATKSYNDSKISVKIATFVVLTRNEDERRLGTRKAGSFGSRWGGKTPKNINYIHLFSISSIYINELYDN